VLFGWEILNLRPERAEVKGGFPNAFPQAIEEVFGLDGRNDRDTDVLTHDISLSFVIEPREEFFSNA
jgi:hypothetical protein